MEGYLATPLGQMQTSREGGSRSPLRSWRACNWAGWRNIGFAALLAAIAQNAYAADTPSTDFSPRLWISPGIYSAHFDRSKNLRNDNPGLSVEYQFAEDHSISGGSYINSNGLRTRYGAYAWRPLRTQVAGLDLRAGVALGVFDGYPYYRDGAPFIAPLPVIGIEGERFGVNLIVIPTIRDRLYGALAFQFKIKLW
jgi:hypothetical protein